MVKSFCGFIANSLKPRLWSIIPVVAAVLCIAYALKAAIAPSLGIDIWYHEGGWQVAAVYLDGVGIQEGDVLVQIGDLHYEDASRQRGRPWLANSVQPGDEVTVWKRTSEGAQPVVISIPPRSAVDMLTGAVIALCALAFCGTAFVLSRNGRTDAVMRLTVLVLTGYGVLITVGSVSGLQIWYSSPLLHAISWLLMVGVMHLYWAMLPLRRIPAGGWWALYMMAVIMAGFELLMLAPQNLFYAATLGQIIGGIFLLSVQVSIYNPAPQRTILFGYMVAFLPGFLWVMADVFVRVSNDIFAVMLSVVATSLWPLFHWYAVHPPTSPGRDARFRFVLVSGTFGVLFLAVFSILATAVRGMGGWNSNASLVVGVGCVLLLLASIWVYDRYRVAVNQLLGGEVSNRLQTAVIELAAIHFDDAETAVNVSAKLLRDCGIRPCALSVGTALYPHDTQPPAEWQVLAIPLSGGVFYVGQKHGRAWYSPAEVQALAALGEYLFLLATRDAMHHKMMADDAAREQVYTAMVLHEKMTALGEIAGSLAHELRTPLQTIITSLGTAVEFPQVAGEEIDRALGQTRRISDLIRTISNYSRPSSDLVTLVDVNAAISDTLTLCDVHIRGCGATLETHIPGKLPPVRMSPTEMTTVLSNLIINACDAMAGQEAARLILQVVNRNGITITVIDNGVGIAEEDKGRLFTLFFTTKDPHGHGLGLYQCYNIVSKRGGRVDVSSKAGVGTTFIVWLPPAA